MFVAETRHDILRQSLVIMVMVRVVHDRTVWAESLKASNCWEWKKENRLINTRCSTLLLIRKQLVIAVDISPGRVNSRMFAEKVSDSKYWFRVCDVCPFQGFSLA